MYIYNTFSYFFTFKYLKFALVFAITYGGFRHAIKSRDLIVSTLTTEILRKTNLKTFNIKQGTYRNVPIGMLREINLLVVKRVRYLSRGELYS